MLSFDTLRGLSGDVSIIYLIRETLFIWCSKYVEKFQSFENVDSHKCLSRVGIRYPLNSINNKITLDIRIWKETCVINSKIYICKIRTCTKSIQYASSKCFIFSYTIAN